MGSTFTIWAGVPVGWVSNTIVQCGPNMLTQRRRELQASPTASMSPAVGSTVIFTYVMPIPLNAPASQIEQAQTAVITATTSSLSSLTISLVSASFPQATVISVFGSVNGVACASSGAPSCASLFSPAPAPAPATAPIGAIIGGVVGGIVVIAAIMLTVLLCRRAQARAAEAATLQAAAAAAQADPTPRDNDATSQFTHANPMAAPKDARSLDAVSSAHDGRAPGVTAVPLDVSLNLSPSRAPVAPIIYASSPNRPSNG